MAAELNPPHSADQKHGSKRVAVIGGGWAGLTAAMQACHQGHRVDLFEMAPQLGGRARSADFQASAAEKAAPKALRLDNGQHILIGAYTQTLSCMQRLGIHTDTAFLRMPLALVGPDGVGLKLPPGNPSVAFLRACLAVSHWRLRDRLRLLLWAGTQLRHRFQCDPQWTVTELCRHLPSPVQAQLIEPLCVAALNTPATSASAAVFLRVLQDALLSGPGSSDLLLPRQPLGALLPEPAHRTLVAAGTGIHLTHRVNAIRPHSSAGWWVDGTHFDGVILACSSKEAARLAEPWAPQWAADAQSLRFEPIITAYFGGKAHKPAWAAPMLMLPSDTEHQPAQFVFDHGEISGHAGVYAAVVSGAAAWVKRGPGPTEAALRAQLHQQLPGTFEGECPLLGLITEKRATFSCSPALRRPTARVADALSAAGDYIEGPYPATLEGAVRSGMRAAQSVFRVNSAD